jgi:hypothetical protein
VQNNKELYVNKDLEGHVHKLFGGTVMAEKTQEKYIL